MKKILLTNGAYKQTLALTRVLGVAGYEVGVVGHRRLSVSFFSKSCRFRHVIAANGDEKRFISELSEILKKNKYDVLLPVGYPEVGWINDHVAQLQSLVKLPLLPFKSLKIFENKAQTHAFATQLGIPVPKTFQPRTRAEAAACLAALNFPIVLKNLKEGQNRIAYAHTEGEFWALFDDFSNQNLGKNASNTEGGYFELKIKNSAIKNFGDDTFGELSKFTERSQPPHSSFNIPNSSFLIQEFLTGEGIGFFARYDNGVLQQSYQHRRLREYPVDGGAACFAETIDNQQIRTYGERILTAANWQGVAMVEFKLDSEGQPRLLEVNPKFWGSYDLCVAAGVDFAVPLVRQILSEIPPSVKMPKMGVRFSWFMNGDGLHGIETGHFWSVLKDFFNPKTQSNLVGRDPLASCFLIISGLIPILKSLLRRIFVKNKR